MGDADAQVSFGSCFLFVWTLASSTRVLPSYWIVGLGIETCTSRGMETKLRMALASACWELAETPLSGIGSCRLSTLSQPLPFHTSPPTLLQPSRELGLVEVLQYLLYLNVCGLGSVWC